MKEEDRAFFAENGFVNLGKVLGDDEVAHFLHMFDADRERYGYCWHPYGYHQAANYDALVTTPEFDQLVRHPRILPVIEGLMGGPLCFGEIGLRLMPAYEGEVHQGWHRDRPHWQEHPLRMDYIQLMVYFTDVDDATHCFSLSPEAVGDEVLDREAQLERGGQYHLHGPAGTAALFNVAVLHTATTRPTPKGRERKTAQIYYGHRDRRYLANDSAIPATFWRDHPDPETRAFYGVLNERTRLYHRAFARAEEVN